MAHTAYNFLSLYLCLKLVCGFKAHLIKFDHYSFLAINYFVLSVQLAFNHLYITQIRTTDRKAL